MYDLNIINCRSVHPRTESLTENVKNPITITADRLTSSQQDRSHQNFPSAIKQLKKIGII